MREVVFFLTTNIVAGTSRANQRYHQRRFIFHHCVVPENIHTPPPAPHHHLSYPTEGNGISRGEGPKRDNFRGGGGSLTEFVFSGGLGKIGKLSINNSFSVEQAISYFTVTGVSKQVLLFALIIFYLRSAKCVFHGVRDSFL